MLEQKLRDCYYYLKRMFKFLCRKDIFPFRDVKIPYFHLGNRGASWCIHTESLNSESIIYSVGVGTDISFDLALIEKCNLEVNAFDPTPKSILWLKNQKSQRVLFYMNTEWLISTGR